MRYRRRSSFSLSLSLSLSLCARSLSLSLSLSIYLSRSLSFSRTRTNSPLFLPPVRTDNHSLVYGGGPCRAGGVVSLALKEYEYALQACIARFLTSVATFSADDTTQGSLLQIEGLQARYFSESELQARKLSAGSILTLRSLIVAAVCIHKFAVAQDPQCLSKFTADKMDHACRLLQQVMEAAQSDESAAWIVYNGTIHIYDISRYALPRGLAANVLEYTLWAILMTESLTPLATVKYLPWRTQLYVMASKCYFDVGQSASSLTLAERCLTNISTLEELEKLSDGSVDSRDVFLAARLTIAQVVFRHQVWYTRKRRTNFDSHKIRGNHMPDSLASTVEWPRNFVEDMLMKQFGGREERFLAILEALTNNQRRTLQQCQLFSNDSPENHTVDRDTLARFADSASHLFNAGRDLCLRQLGTDDAKCDANMLYFVQLAFNYEQNDVFNSITEVLLGQKSVFTVLNPDREAPEDDEHATRCELRTTSAQVKLLTLLLTFVEARQTSKSKQTTLINAVTCFPSTVPVPVRAKVRSAFPSKVVSFAEALADIIAEDPEETKHDLDLLHDAALFLWARCKPYYAKFSSLAEVAAAATHIVDPETGEPQHKYKTLQTIHRCLTISGSAISDPLVYGAVTLKLGMFCAGLDLSPAAETVLSQGIRAVEMYRARRSQHLHPVCMFTTQQQLQIAHGGNQGMELHNRFDGLVCSLELDLRVQLWTTQMAELDANLMINRPPKSSTKLIATPVAASTKRRLGATRRGDMDATGKAPKKLLSWRDISFCGPVAAMVQDCGNDRVKLATLLSLVANKVGSETAGKYKKALLLLEEAARLMVESEAQVQRRCAAAGQVQDTENVLDATTGIKAPMLLRNDHGRVSLRTPQFNVATGSVNVHSVRVFGRQLEDGDANEVVRLSDNKLAGTDKPFYSASSNAEITVSDLKSNRNYIFAFAAYDSSGTLIGQIGATSELILTSHPLPAALAWGHLASNASAVGASQIVRAASSWMWNYFMSTDSTLLNTDPANGCCVNIKQLRLASTPELLAFCQVTMQLVDERMSSEALFANDFVHSPSLQASQPVRLALCRQALVVAEVALSISDAAMAVHAITKGYSLLANFVFHGIDSSPCLRMLLFCHNVLLALLNLPLNQLPDTVKTDVFFHMCTCISYYVTNALYKSHDFAAAESAAANAVSMLSMLGDIRCGTSIESAKQKNKNKNSKESKEQSPAKAFGEHLTSELQNCLVWLAAKYRLTSNELKLTFTPSKDIESLVNLYSMLCNHTGQLPDLVHKGIHLPTGHPRFLEMAGKWIKRAVEVGQYAVALEWGKEVVKQASIKGEKPPPSTDPRKLSAVVRHSAPGTPRAHTPKSKAQLKIEAKLRINVLASEDLTEAEYDQRMADLLKLRHLLTVHLGRCRSRNEVRAKRQEFYNGYARWVSQVHMLSGVANMRIFTTTEGAERLRQDDSPYDTCAVRQASALDGYIHDFKAAPLATRGDLDEPPFEPIFDCLTSYRKAVVIAARSKSWVQVRNVCAVIFNVARLVGPIKEQSKFGANLQLTVATAMDCLSDVLLVHKTSGRLLVETPKGDGAENADMVLARDMFSLAVPICVSIGEDGAVTGRYTKNIIETGLALLAMCKKEDFDAIYSPLELIVRGVHDNERAADLLDAVVNHRERDIIPLTKDQEKMRKCRVALANAAATMDAITPVDLKRPMQLCSKVTTPQAKHKLGDLLFSDNDAAGAAECWVNAAASLLSLPVDLGNWVQEDGSRLKLVPKVALIIQRQPLWARLEAASILGKLSKYCFQDDVDKCINAARLAAVFISHAVLSCSGDGEWATKDYTHGFHENACPGFMFLNDAHAGTVETLLETLQHDCSLLINSGFACDTLPALAVYELLANEACFDFASSINARLLRMEALSALGLFSDALLLCSELVSGGTDMAFVDGQAFDTNPETGTWEGKMKEALSTCKAGSVSPDTMAPATVLCTMRISEQAVTTCGGYLSTQIEVAHGNLICAYASRLLCVPDDETTVTATDGDKSAHPHAHKHPHKHNHGDLGAPLDLKHCKTLLVRTAEDIFAKVALASSAEVSDAGLDSRYSEILFYATAGRAQVAALRCRFSVAANLLDAALVLAEECSQESRIPLGPLLQFKCLVQLCEYLQQAQSDDVCSRRCDDVLELAQMCNYSGAMVAVTLVQNVSKCRLGLDAEAREDLETSVHKCSTGVVPMYVACSGMAALGDRYCDSGESGKGLTMYEKAQGALHSYVDTLFGASMNMLLSDAHHHGGHVKELELHAKIQVSLADAATSLLHFADGCAESKKAVEYAKALCHEEPAVIVTALLAAVRAQRLAGNMDASVAQLEELCTYVASVAVPGDNLKLVQAICIELYTYHAHTNNNKGAVASIVAAAHVTAQLQDIFRWQDRSSDIKQLDAALVAGLACPSLALPLLASVGVEELLAGSIDNGDTALARARETANSETLLKRRADLESVRGCTAFDAQEAVVLRELNTFISAHVLPPEDDRKVDVNELFVEPAAAKLKDPAVSLVWSCKTRGAEMITLYFVDYGSTNEGAVVHRTYSAEDITGLHSKISLIATSSSANESISVIEAATLLGDVEPSAEDETQSLPAEALGELGHLLNPAFGGTSTTPAVVTWLQKVLQ